MKYAYLDCQSGISGDMFLAACVDAGADFETICQGINSLRTGNCRLEKREVQKYGFRALKIDVMHEPEHAHRHLHHINEMIDQSSITLRQKELAKAIFLNLGKAEAKVHGSSLEKVHFHEVGAIDSIADIVGGAIAWDLLGCDKLVCSPIPTGQGQIKIAHGIVSIPAPATAELLTGIPLQPSAVSAELTTPTGAAIAATLADEYGRLPEMKIQHIGIGAGTKDLEEQANVLRILIGKSDAATIQDHVVLLETNLDDVSSECIGYCQQRLWAAGALDVFTTAIQMKKNRPGVLLSVLCSPESVSELQDIVFAETGTLGIRQRQLRRTLLRRTTSSVETQWGSIEGKLVSRIDGRQDFVPEYESCAIVAERSGKSLPEVFEIARQAFQQ